MNDELPLFGDRAACDKARPTQLGLPLGWRRAERQLVVGASLAQVWRALFDLDRTPDVATLLVGPPRSGRTLIGEALRARGYAVVDDIEQRSDDDLFYAWNRAREEAAPLLMIARADFSIDGRALPDLRTRLGSATRVEVGRLDPCEVRARVVDAASQVGSHLGEPAASYIAARVERSHVAVAAVCDALSAHLAAGGGSGLPAVRAMLASAGLIDTGAVAA